MIEKHPAAAQSLLNNLKLLNAHNAQVLNTDALSYLGKFADEPFDVVFLDPPFQLNLWQSAIELLDRYKLLAEGCAIYVESGLGDQYSTPVSWELHRDKTAGNLRYRLFYHHIN